MEIGINTSLMDRYGLLKTRLCTGKILFIMVDLAHLSLMMSKDMVMVAINQSGYLLTD